MDKKQNVYKIIMLLALTIVITVIITSIVVYDALGGNSIKYIVNTGASSSIGKLFITLKIS